MSSQSQSEYIRDLATLKLKEFKEFKELLVANQITDGDTALNAKNLSEAVHALTDLQASKVIEILIMKPRPKRESSYSDKRIKKAVDLLDEILADIDDWDFSS